MTSARITGVTGLPAGFTVQGKLTVGRGTAEGCACGGELQALPLGPDGLPAAGAGAPVWKCRRCGRGYGA